VGQRGGYYDTVGAIDDMLIHLYSLLKMVFPNPILPQNIDLQTKQYDSYKQEVSNSNSTTETYFAINCRLGNIKLFLESGKKQTQKLTKIDINKGEYILELAPNKQLFYEGKTISLDDQKSDHCRILEAMQKQDYTQFVSDSDILEYFNFLEKVKTCKNK
jgi:glucose-6-phosphate 1-dehydrogenase